MTKNEIELPSKCIKFLVSNNVAWEGNRYRIEHKRSATVMLFAIWLPSFLSVVYTIIEVTKRS